MGVMEIALGALMVGSTVQQQRAQNKAADAQKKAEMQARKIAAEKKPMEETATLSFGDTQPQDTLGSLGLLVDPQQRSKTQLGMGSPTVSKLGFGG